MNQLKMKSWMLTQSYPLYLCIVDALGKDGGKTFESPDPMGYDVYPTKEQALHPVARKNFEDYIETFEEFKPPEPQATITLEQSLAGKKRK